jgi:hypothetical protein
MQPGTSSVMVRPSRVASPTMAEAKGDPANVRRPAAAADGQR